MKVFRIVLFLCAIAVDGYALPIQQDSTPTLVSLSPASAVQGATIEVRLTGSNFAAGGTSVTPSSGLVVNSVHVDSSVTLRALFQVVGPPGTVNLSVTTLGGTSSSMAFEIRSSPLDSAAPLEATHFAGSIGGWGFNDGTGAQARFTNSCGCGSWTDGTSLFLTDSNAIRQITIATQVVTTIAGSAETAGFVDGVGTAARFSTPAGIWGSNNVLYVADSGNSAIRKIDLSSGQVTTAILLPGSPSHLYGDANNLLYVSDVSNVFTGGLGGTNVGFYRIRAVNLDTGVVATVAQYSPQSNSGPQPFVSVDVWTDGLNLYIADGNISVVRRIYLPTSASNIVASFNDDGRPEWIWSDGVHLYVVCNTGIIRVLDPNAVNASSLASPQLITQKEGGPLTGYGNFVYAHLTQIDVTAGNTTVLAGSVNQSGTLDGIGSAALFTMPGAVWGDGKTLYVSDSDGLNNNTIRKVDLATAQVTTLPVVPAQQPFAQALWGDEDYLYSTGSYRVNRISRATGEFSIFAGSGVSGEVDGVGTQVKFLAAGNLWGNDTTLFVADRTAVRRIDKATGTVTTLAGGTAFGDKDGIGSAASFSGVRGIWGDGVNLYVTDAIYLRKIVIATTEVTTLASGFSGGIWGDGTYLYALDGSGPSVRRLSLATGEIAFLAGSLTDNPVYLQPVGAEDGIGTVAEFNQPSGIWGDGTSLYISESGNNAIRKLGVPGAVNSPASFTAAIGGETALLTGDGAGDLTVGFASVQLAVGSGAPDGFAVIQLRQNNVLISEVAIPASPTISSGRIYAEVNGPVNTGIAIANPNSRAATINFYFTDASGTDFGSSSFTIPAGGQIAKFLTEAPFNNSSTFAGTVTFNASFPVAAVALRGFTNERSEFLMTSLPVATLPSVSTAVSLLPHFADGGGWSTNVLLVNSSDQSIAGTVTFVPALTLPVAYSIPAHSSYAVKTPDTAVNIQTGYVLVAPASGNPAPVAQGIFSFVDNGVTVTAAGVPSIGPANAFRIYAEAEGSVQTGVALANPSQTTATVTLNLTNPDGTQAGTATLVVPAGSHIAMFLSQIPGLLPGTGPFQGVLRLSTLNAGGISVLGLRGRYNERSDFLISEMPSFSDSIQPLSELYVPHFADGGGYDTQFILLGPTGQNSAGVLQFFSQSGQSLALSLNAAYVGP